MNVQHKPVKNIIMIIADQLRPDMLGCYGNPVAKTPNIDGLAAQGILFENSYSTCPVCVPARASLLSGQYCATNGVYDNGGMLRSDEPTMCDFLNIDGFDTALIGKAHFIGPDQLHGFRRRPLTNVYPANLAFMPDRDAGLDSSNLHPNPIALDYLGENVGIRSWSMEIDYDEQVVQESLRYLAERKRVPVGSAQEPLPPVNDQPFFLQISLNHPHEPFHVLQEYWDRYEGVDIPLPEIPDGYRDLYTPMDHSLARLHGTDRIDVSEAGNLRTLRRAYLAAVSYFDDQVGKILAAVERFGLTEESMIVLVSDHGDMLGDKGMVQKRVLYDPSVKIPLIFRFPRQSDYYRPGRRVGTPVSITDIAPTCLAVVGTEDYFGMDGESLLPLIGSEDSGRAVFCENYSEGVTEACIMVRQGKWKYTRSVGGTERLYDIDSDPGEWRDLASDEAYGILKEELAALIAARFDLEDIERKAAASYKRRKIIQASTKMPGAPTWNWSPPDRSDSMFWRL